MENQGIAIDSKQWMKKFLPIWSAQLFSLLGSGLVQFALVWYLTQKTGSAEILAMATFVALLPDVLLAPFAGALVDRWNRRIVMILADGSTAFFTLVLAVLFLTGKVQIWHIFVVLFLREAGGTFQWPAMQSSTSLMVPDEHLSRVAGINQAIRGGLNIVAAPLGALLMTLLPFYQVISIDIVTAIIAITPLFFISIPQPKRKVDEAPLSAKAVLGDMGEAFKFMKVNPGILWITIVAAFLNFVLAPTDTFLPLLVIQHFHLGALQLSMLQSGMGIGVVIGGLLLGVWGGFKNRVLTSMLGIMGIGAGIVLVGIAPSQLFYMALAGMVLCGIMNAFGNGPIMAIMQSKVPPEMQGRVMGLVSSICMAMMPLAMLISAPVVKVTGLQAWYWASGIITIALGAAALCIPQIIGLEKHMEENTAATESEPAAA